MKTAFWFAALLGVALVACGNLTSSPQDPPDTSPGGDASTVQAGTAPRGGSPGGVSGTGGAFTLTMTAGTTSSNAPLDPGRAGAGGQPDYPAVAHLCIYPEDIPESWQADGGAGGSGGAGAEVTGLGRNCTVGVVGGFNYQGCVYELLSPTPFDVDPFVGGHSHCCYSAKLIACK